MGWSRPGLSGCVVQSMGCGSGVGVGDGRGVSVGVGVVVGAGVGLGIGVLVDLGTSVGVAVGRGVGVRTGLVSVGGGAVLVGDGEGEGTTGVAVAVAVICGVETGDRGDAWARSRVIVGTAGISGSPEQATLNKAMISRASVAVEIAPHLPFIGRSPRRPGWLVGVQIRRVKSPYDTATIAASSISAARSICASVVVKGGTKRSTEPRRRMLTMRPLSSSMRPMRCPCS